MFVTIHKLLESHPELSCGNARRFYRTFKEKGSSITEFYGWGIPSVKKKGRVYRNVSLNVFEGEPVTVPSGYRSAKLNAEDTKLFVCDLSKNLLSRSNSQYARIKASHRYERSYFTHDNGGRPFLVYISKKRRSGKIRVSIYKISEQYFFLPNVRGAHKWQYTELVKKYSAKTVWIGENILGPPRNWKAKGNSILLQLTNSKHVHIGIEIFEFETSDEIERYESNVGGSDVPYPSAVGEQNVYYMLDHVYGPRPGSTDTGMDMYGRFYTDKQVSKNVKPLLSFKMIHERID